MGSSPNQLVEQLVQQRVTVRLKDRRELTGRLLGIDEHMNLVLDEAEEHAPELTRRLGRVLLRGSNLTSLHATGGKGARAPG